MKARRKHTSHRQTQLMPERIHDPYQSTLKPAGHAVCPDCGVVFEEGRWHWGARHPEAKEERCPACRRIKEKLPAGFVRLEGPFVAEHHQDIMSLVRNHEMRVKAEHALQRIMGIDEHPDHVLITTTDIHLARGIGEAVRHAYQGDLEFHYNDGETLLRVRWHR